MPVSIKTQDDLSGYDLLTDIIVSGAIYVEDAYHLALLSKMPLRRVNGQNHVLGELH